MAKVVLMPGIASISGKLDKVIFKTNKKGQTFVYSAERRPRKTKISEKEKAHREKFAQVCAYWKSLNDYQKRSWATMYTEELGRFNGKTYNTLRGYVIAVMMSGMTASPAETNVSEQQNGSRMVRKCSENGPTLAFGKEDAQTDDPVVIKATPASALPTANSQRLGLRRGPQYRKRTTNNKK